MSRPSSVVLTGPLAPFADGFADRLAVQGYSVVARRSHRRLLAHLDQWLVGAGLGGAVLTAEMAEDFLRMRRETGSTQPSDRGLKPLLRYLAELGRLPAASVVRTPTEELVDLFRRHQLDERGLGTTTVASHERVARLFLATRSEPLRVSVAELSAADIGAFVREQAAKQRASSAQIVVSGLRALLTFLHVAGWTPRNLSSAVLTVARRQQDLPKALAGDEVKRLLGSCDRATSVGIRDFAVLTMLARLGIRAGEVARMELGDIDWRAGEVMIHGKGSRVDRLPLPCDVGAAVADYLRRGRPVCGHRRLFMTSRAPHTGLSRAAIGGIVHAAGVRASILPLGPHRLRHTVATELLRKGAPLPEIAQLLRHRNIQTTAIYAKVDTTALMSVAQVWPGDEA
jgi:integrase/recombinase XerD